ncbi:MAG TPA: SDR family NAD(P)-dependent oxidoreductase, partial [Candidatus Portnoybacteria bacterium]|nr:SDR family NAD(P)-dependent oxidoreductase [Candidatus Portnoybacteria bacterium]
FNHRLAVAVKNNLKEAINALKEKEQIPTSESTESDRPVVFMFPGQGSQYINMGRELYDNGGLFKQEMDYGFSLVKRISGVDFKKIIYPKSNQETEQAKLKIDKVEYSQPLLFIFEYALGRFLLSLGVAPDYFIGHSLGEYTAACFAGVFSQEDALKFIIKRAEFLKNIPSGGAMLAISISSEKLKLLIADFNHQKDKESQIEIAAINSPSLCVISSTIQAVAEFEEKLAGAGFQFKRLRSDQAMHSQQLDPVLKKTESEAKKIKLKKPTKPFISSLTGDFISDDEAISPAYWAKQFRQAVLFDQGIKELLKKEEGLIFIEVGPGNDLSTFFRQQPEKKKTQTAVSLIKKENEKDLDFQCWLSRLGLLWLYGTKINWPEFHLNRRRIKVPLPTYPFERQRYWPEEKETGAPGWFYAPLWEKREVEKKLEIETKGYLVFCSDQLIVDRLSERLKDMILVRPARQFKEISRKEYVIDPSKPKDYIKLIGRLEENNCLPGRIIHAWGFGSSSQEKGFYSLIFLAQALGRVVLNNSLVITVLTKNLQPVLSRDKVLCPEQALMLGPIKLISKEYPGIKCQVLDLDDFYSAEDIIAETKTSAAFRSGQRYEEFFKPLELKEEKRFNFKFQGNYLIAGGLGAIGFSFAEYLAKEFQANLILVSRTNSADKIKKIEKLKQYGSRVLFVSADIANRPKLESALAKARKSFGRIDGVIQAAGVVDGLGLIQKRSKKGTQRNISAKIEGTINLFELIEKPDFFLLCSSLAAISAPAGEVGYVAANNFLDYFAQAKNSSEAKVVSVNWPVWAGSGMGALARERRNQASDTQTKINFNFSASKRIKHFLFDRYISDTKNSQEIYFSHFSPKKNWFLSEHKIGGRFIVPGSVYLEMARAAVAKYGLAGEGICIKDAYFIEPLEIAPEQTRRLAAVVKKENGRAFSFSVFSQGGLGFYQERAAGKICFIDGQTGTKHDVKKMKEKYSQQLPLDKEPAANNFVEVGPRWQSLKQVFAAGNRGFGYLKLPKKFLHDIRDYKLHPALLDLAVSSTARIVSQRPEKYLPLSYRSLVIKRPLTNEMYSFVEPAGSNGTSGDNLIFNIILTDISGNELVSVEEFIIRKVNEGIFSEDGLPSTEAVNLFGKIIGNGFARVAVSPGGFPEKKSASVKEEKNFQFKAEAQEDSFVGAETERQIAAVWRDVLGLEEIGANDNFFDVGGNSLNIIQVAKKIKEKLKRDIPIASFFQYLTIGSLAKYLNEGQPESIRKEKILTEKEIISSDIAVIGLAGKFPGAENIDSFWQLLKNGKEGITFFSDEDLARAGVPEGRLRDKNYVKAKGIISKIEYFDAHFFGYTGREAQIMDPQIRLFHELAWQALENSGYNPKTDKKIIGLYAGATFNLGWLNAVSPFIGSPETTAIFEALEFINKDYLATRIAHKFDLRGPVLNVDTSSSSSLVAVDLARAALLDNKCDIILAGGVRINNLSNTGYVYEEGVMLSPDGHTRAFDKDSTGTVWSDGLGVVVLKRLAEAVADGDNILAVIKGSAVNNDGGNKINYFAPSINGQAKVVRMAQEVAGISSETISYIEAHGTGTPIGDPIEVEALKQAFGTDNKQYCGLGSLKPNIGHINAAAGVAGFIKTVLALQHKLIPASINYTKPNPK